MGSTTLWKLPGTSLPEVELKDAVIVTIWLVATIVFGICFHYLPAKQLSTWPEFKAIKIGTFTLALWYLMVTTDRWLHCYGRSVIYGYIILTSFWESVRVSSTIILLWGTYKVVWRELESRFDSRQRRIWWIAARFAIFVVGLMSIYYVVLYLALAIVWMEFLSLNTIADIATKRNQFELSITVFFFVFCLLTGAAATAAVLWQGQRVDGSVRKTRILLWLATVMLFARSTAEMAITAQVYGPAVTRRDVLFPQDVIYGLLTFLYLGAICIMAWQVTSGFDQGGRDARRVESDIREYILKKLQQETNGARMQSPAFVAILDGMNDLDKIVAEGSLSSTTQMRPDHRRIVAVQCIQRLRNEFGRLDPKQGIDYNARSTSRITEFFSRTPGAGGRRPGGSASHSDMRNTSRRTTPAGSYPNTSRHTLPLI
ncbi:hypothetical protein F4677DRAFT_448685 [Hypoxylon crocopeplum]|nr:hypothetical protein F4677DRAFT_448685 [Hypoxylon crocopeplum]